MNKNVPIVVLAVTAGAMQFGLQYEVDAGPVFWGIIDASFIIGTVLAAIQINKA